MTLKTVTFDFHNTLASCDDWFEVEVRDLLPRFLAWREVNGGAPVTPAIQESARQHYRAIRRDIAGHGNELNAACAVEEVLRQLDVPVDQDEIRVGVDAIMLATLVGVTPLPGAVSTVRELAAAGVTLGIVSSAAHHDFLEWTLDRFGIAEAFTAVVSSASCGYYKSKPDIYSHALRVLGATPADTVHIGDSHLYDVETARQLGIRTVWLAADDGAEHAADMRVDSFEGLAPLLLARF